MTCAMHGENRRREVRYRVRIAAKLVRGKQALDLMTEDVSHRGAFLRTDAPPGIRQLVELRMCPVQHEREIALFAMVIHVIKPGGTRTPGFGVEFYKPGAEERARWGAF